MSEDTRPADHLASLHISRTEAAPATQLTDNPELALQYLGRNTDGSVFLSLKDISEWYSVKHQRYYYAIKGAPTTSWDAPLSFQYNEWLLDSQLYNIPIATARDIYTALDGLLTKHPTAVGWAALNLLSKIISNIADCSNTIQKYRSIKTSNEKFKSKVCDVHGALDVLTLAGFESQDDAVVFPADSIQLNVLKATASRAQRLLQHKGHSGSAKPDDSGKDSSGNNNNTSTRPPSPFYGTPGFLYQERIYHCNVCDHPINDGSERLWTRQHEAPHGEYRYQCTTCEPPLVFNVCQQCWDKMQQGEVLHPPSHRFQHIGPRMSRHNDYYGAQGGGGGGEVNASNPWGNQGLGSGYSRGLSRLRERYGLGDMG